MASKLRCILSVLDQATQPSELDNPAWRLHPLGGDLAGYWSIRVTGNMRLVFRAETWLRLQLAHDLAAARAVHARRTCGRSSAPSSMYLRRAASGGVSGRLPRDFPPYSTSSQGERACKLICYNITLQLGRPLALTTPSPAGKSTGFSTRNHWPPRPFSGI